MKRRTLIAAATGSLLYFVLSERSPATDSRTVGILIGLANDAETQARSTAFEKGLRADGWIQGKNLRLEYRYANGDPKLMQAYANEFVAMKVDCILGHSTPVVAALARATKTIPIVFVSVSDPIGSGFIKSMAHPGGNITGFTILQPTIPGKHLSMLHEIAPNLTHVALMYNPHSVPDAGTFFMRAFIDAANEYKIKPIIAEVNGPKDIEAAISGLAVKPGGGLITVPDNFLTLHRDLLISLAAKYRIPTVYPYRYFAEAGGLISYGVDAVDLFQRATDYVSRILRGAKPADLPVQGPTKFELVINVRTAQALGLTIPRFMLAGADKILEK